MKKFFLLIFILIGVNVFGQWVPINSRERVHSLKVDSVNIIPRGLTGSNDGWRVSPTTGNKAGQLRYNPTDSSVYVGTEFQFLRMAKYGDISSINQKYGHASGDFQATEDRSFNYRGTYFKYEDSVSSYEMAFNANNGWGIRDYILNKIRLTLTASHSRLQSQDATNYYHVDDGQLLLGIGSGDSLVATNIPYSSSDRLVALQLDTLTNRVYRKTASGGVPTLQQVLDAGSTLTSNETIDVGSNELTISQSAVHSTVFGSSGSAVRGTSANNVGVYGISTDDVAGVAAENSSTTAASLQVIKGISNTHLATPGIDLLRTTTGTALNGIGSKIRFITETSSGAQDTANKIESVWSTVTHASRESQMNIYGVDNTTQETFMNIQKDLVRINNNADTLATLQDVRDGGAGGGISAADLPLRITGSTVSADTSVAYEPSLTTNERLYNTLDSLQAAGWGQNSLSTDYKYYMDMSNNTQAGGFFQGTGTGAAATIPGTPPYDGWFYGRQLVTGTTSTGRAYCLSYNAGYSPIAINNSYRYRTGARVRLEDLSDGTETYGFMFGFMDDVNNYSSVVDGVGFRYTHSDSSGAFIAWTKSNSTITEDATDITAAADTEYFLQIEVFGGSAYFYINGVLKATISTNIPTGTTRYTSLGISIHKSAGTTSRALYVPEMGYDKRYN